MSTRIQITRENLVAQFTEVQQPPEILNEKLKRAPFIHCLSTYVIRPVACDQLPFMIHHKNKQQIITVQKPRAGKKGLDGVKEVDNFEDDQEEEDDEFETVKADKKRVKKPVQWQSPVEFDPRFPASDPTKVKVVDKIIKKPLIVKPDEKKPQEKSEVPEVEAPKEEKPVVQKQEIKKEEPKPVVAAPKKKIVEEVKKPAVVQEQPTKTVPPVKAVAEKPKDAYADMFMSMMNKTEGGKAPEPKKEQEQPQQKQKQQPPKSARGPKKQQPKPQAEEPTKVVEEQKKPSLQNIMEEAKTEKKKMPKVKIQLEDIVKEEQKAPAQSARLPQTVVTGDDYISQMMRGSQITEQKDAEKKAIKAQRRKNRGAPAEGGKGGQGAYKSQLKAKKNGMDALYD